MLELSVLPAINFASQQNQVPLIRSLTLTNTSEQDWTHLQLTILPSPEFAQPFSYSIDTLKAGESYELKNLALTVSTKFLAALTERLHACLEISLRINEISAQAEPIPHISQTHPIAILPYDHWSGLTHLPELIAAFSTPNHPQIPAIIRRAAIILQSWTGSPSFDAYQSKNPNRVRKQMAAVFEAIAEYQFIYCSVAASFEENGQRIRLTDSIFKDRLANCLDISLLYTACLEAIGLHPILVFIKGHAFAGAWLIDESFADAVNDDPSLLTKRMANGINEIVLVEAVAMNAGQSSDFEKAVWQAEQHMIKMEEFQLFVDLKRSRFAGIRPLPLRIATSGGWEIQEDQISLRINQLPDDIVTGPAINHLSKITVTKQQIWERKLLDLSLRNNLLNIRFTKTMIQLMSADISQLEDELSQNTEFQVLPKPGDWDNSGRDAGLYRTLHQSDPITELLEKEFGQKRLRAYLSDPELTINLTNLYRASRLSMEENGANTLYLGLGLLRWYETSQSEQARYAPILLMPVEIIRKTSHKGFIIRSREEETILNITLMEMLRQDFGIFLSMDRLPRDEKGINIQAVFSIIRQAVMVKSRWDIEESAILGTFSFSKFILWHDIHQHADLLQKNPLVQSLLTGRLVTESESPIKPEDISDAQLRPEELALPISTDSSQLQAILGSARGRSFVLHGPPGTGKSQTITNIIANALYSGKRVLFVAAKKAALEVVESRLNAIGIGPFCLELHSNKAKKSAVLDQLKASTELAIKSAPESFQRDASRLFELRSELHQYVELLHRQQSFGLSLFDLFTQYSQFPKSEDQVFFPPESINGTTADQWSNWQDLAAELQDVGSIIQHPKDHGLAELQLPRYTSQIKAELTVMVGKIKILLEELKLSSKQVAELAGLSTKISTLSQEEAVLRLTSGLLKLPDTPANLLNADSFEQRMAQLIGLIPHGLKRDEIRNELLTDFNKGLLDINAVGLLAEWNAAEHSWFLSRWLKQNKLSRSIRQFAKTGKLTKEAIISTLHKIIAYKEEQEVLENAGWLSETLGFAWNDGHPDWKNLEDSITHLQAMGREIASILPLEEIRQWRNVMAGKFIEGSKYYIDLHAASLKNYRRILNDLFAALDNSKSLLGFDWEKEARSNLDWKENLHALCTKWLFHSNKLKDWFNYTEVRARAKQAGLKPLIQAYETGLVETQDLLLQFKKGWVRSAAEWVIDQSQVLVSFNGELFDQKVRKFREISNLFQELTREELQARLSASIPAFEKEAAQSSEIGILQRALRSNGRGMSIRKLVELIPGLLPKLKPCMLMSPISVAQYLELGKIEFDLVLFDEASQLPTCEAIGAIARAKKVIVVGDPKQMPPTNFFSTNQIDEENIEKEDLESILDDCLALSMPSQYLLWHYRSKHESLIAFSNAHYYENRLLTFPSPDDIQSRVNYIPVEGIYDRSNTRQNKMEAEAVVNEVIRRLSDPVSSKKSIGIVTFSSTQQILINDQLDKLLSTRPDLEKLAMESEEPLFIKNLENVQGDERDIILFSTCYGPDAEGKISLNFGPINREGGWRRLNVAVSRAREEMLVFSSLRSDQIDLRRTASEGVSNLKAFLSYAEKGKMSLAVNTIHPKRNEDSFEEVVALALRQHGYMVHTHVGTSSYKIDIAVVDPQNEHHYLLGIVTDGKNYYQAGTNRDREIVQIDVLKGLGWNVFKLWSTEWWEMPDRVLARLLTVLEEIRQNGSVKQLEVELEIPNDPPPEFIPTVRKTISFKAAYRPAILRRKTDTYSDEFTYETNQGFILVQLRDILELEAPISKSLLYKRMLNAWGISRMGTRINAHLEQLIQLTGCQVVDEGYNIFFWVDGRRELTSYRIAKLDEFKRSAEDISPEEIAVGVREILLNQVSLLRTDLLKETARLFGYSRLGTLVETVIDSGIQRAIEFGYAVEDGERIKTSDRC
ncbi:DUF3320 domain-containing protein [Flavihumibacter sp. UBA7668]|uniref:DUF3320 domain-containing protein n=1 Tax=Flavihumibacter sp. UBA7668 TaxID=1946542 RepID=UPI0025BA1545|nr:DUF3320 domain-containing protein [Flavihumibacter sp. UBA7668]